MSNQNHRALIEQVVTDAITRIAEHVDTVQIMVTFHSEDGETTCSYDNGRGNFYARQGQVDEWLTMQKEYQKNQAKRNDLE